MAIFFAGAPGRVIAMPDPGVPQTVRGLSVDGGAFSFANFRAIITRAFLSRQGNFQFMHTLGSGIHLFTFGDRIGQMSLSGVAMQGSCLGVQQTGIEQVMAYYEANRIAARESPIVVTLGVSTPFVGYLGAIQADSGDPSLGLYSFTMPLILLPES